MNKKFSTLLAGIMLASAFTAGAQTAVNKYENGKSYLLSAEVSGTKYALTVESDATDPDYGKLSVVNQSTVNQSIQSTNEALWTVSFTEGVSGNAPKFTFINKATGLTLSLNTTDKDKDGEVDDLKIAGSISEWLNTSMTDNGESSLSAAPLYSYIEANKVVYLDITNGALTAKIDSPDAAASASAFAPYEAAIINNLTADDLNTQLQTAEDGWFNLTFNRDVTTAGNNLFANTSLKAKPASTNYVSLIAKDKKVKDANGKDVDAYIVVDTAYYAGSENSGALVKFTYANPAEKKNVNGLGRWADSYEYNFAYDPISICHNA